MLPSSISAEGPLEAVGDARLSGHVSDKTLPYEPYLTIRTEFWDVLGVYNLGRLLNPS